MIRQRAFAWAAILALMATIQSTPLPTRFSLPVAALAQGNAVAAADDSTDLAIVALHCANAPDTEALTSYFSSGTAPTGCAPAVGVGMVVTEKGAPVPGSPFTTDVSGTLAVPVSPGSAIEIREDRESLPAGYEPLTQEANGVPYANPVQLDTAVAGTAVLFVNVPESVAATLADGTLADQAGAPTELAILALHCADAPATEALTSYFSGGTPPSGCTPGGGVNVEVTENEKPLSGSPFQTDSAGTLAIHIGLGSRVTVKEDANSLPDGYEPLVQEANGVPYANPVRLDSAVDGAAVLFVNVPNTVAARLAQGATTLEAGAATNLTHAATRDRTKCDPAYPDERTCIAPGRPLAAPCSITDQRNFTVLAPDPRGLDADGDGIGCEPILPSGGTVLLSTTTDLYTSGGSLRSAARTSDLTVTRSPVRRGDGRQILPPASGSADDWLVQRDRNRAGLWFWESKRSSTGNLAIVSNPVFIGQGLWIWPNRHAQGDWFRQRHDHDGTWFGPDRIEVGNLTVASSGGGNVAIASNPVFIGDGVWSWPNHFGHDDWFRSNLVSVGNITVAGSGNGNIAIASNPVVISRGVGTWPNRFGRDGWTWRDRLGSGFWGRSTNISVGNVTVAGSGNGNIAIVSNPVFISNGVWFWPGNISVGNLVIARSGNGNVAIVSNPVFISSGVWFVQPDRHHDDHWLMRGDRDHADDRLGYDGATQTDSSTVESETIRLDGDGGAQTSGIEQLGTSEQPLLMVNGELAVEPPPAGSLQPTSEDASQLPSESASPASDGSVAPPSDDTTAATDGDDAPAPGTDVQMADASAPDPNSVAPDATAIEPSNVETGTADAGSVAPDPGTDGGYSATDPSYVEPGYVDPGYVAPDPNAVDPGLDPGYVEPEPSYVDPGYVDPNYVDPNYVDSGYVAPDPGSEPIYVAPEPDYVDAGNVDLGSFAPDPGYSAPDLGVDPGYLDPGINVDQIAPEPNYVDAGNTAPDLGMDAGYGGSDPINLAPEPSYVEPSFVDAGNVNPGNADIGNFAPDAGMDVAGNINIDTGNGVADFGGGDE